MSPILNILKKLFNKEVYKFKKLFIEKLDTDAFVNFKQIETNIPIQKKTEIILKMIEKGEIYGRLVPKTTYFLKITDEHVDTWRKKIRNEGYIKLKDLTQIVNLPKKVLNRFLQQLEQGYLTKEHYYSKTYLESYLLQTLNKNDMYDIELIANKLEIEISVIKDMVENFLTEGKLQGVIQDSKMFINKEKFEKQIEEVLEELAESTNEISFEEIATRLKVYETQIEPFLIDYANKHTYECTIYPLEKRIIFKK